LFIVFVPIFLSWHFVKMIVFQIHQRDVELEKAIYSVLTFEGWRLKQIIHTANERYGGKMKTLSGNISLGTTQAVLERLESEGLVTKTEVKTSPDEAGYPLPIIYFSKSTGKRRFVELKITPVSELKTALSLST
jgi:hypothetical protein